MRTKRNSTKKIQSLYLDPQAEINLKFLTESTSALLGVHLTPSIIMRRALELLADRWSDEAVSLLAGKSTAEHKMERLAEFLKEERAELLRAAGRYGDHVSPQLSLQGKVS